MLYEVITGLVFGVLPAPHRDHRDVQLFEKGRARRRDLAVVITSYSIHYTKLYEFICNILSHNSSPLYHRPHLVVTQLFFFILRRISCIV